MARRKAAAPGNNPADKPLTERQQRLVEVLIAAAAEGKELSREEAGRLAGFGGTPECSRTSTYAALKQPNVRRALIEAAQIANQTQVPAYLAAVRHIAGRAKSTRDRLGAARLGMEMAGIVGPGTAGAAVAGAGIRMQIVLTDPVAAASFQQMMNDYPHTRENVEILFEPKVPPEIDADAAQPALSADE